MVRKDDPATLNIKRKPAAAGFLLSMLLILPLALAHAAGTHRPMRFDHLTADDGLSMNSVIGITQDATGFMWFATENGLNQYDGKRIRVIQRQRTDGAEFSNDFIPDLVADGKGIIWLATDGGGLVRWDTRRERFTSFRHSPENQNSLSDDHVNALLVETDGIIWAGTLRSGLNRLDLSTDKITRFRNDPDDPNSISSDAIQALYQDKAGRIWVATDEGLNQFEARSGSFRRFVSSQDDPSSLSDNRVRAIAQDHHGNLWVGTRNGLNRLDISTGSFDRYFHDPTDPGSLSHSRIRVLLEDSAKRLWVGTAAGLNLYNESENAFARYAKDPANPESLADNNIMSLYEDRTGMLWVGTSAGGVSKWNPRSWSLGHFNAAADATDSLSSSNISAFAEDDLGRLWIGTFGGGLNLLDRTDGSVQSFQHEPGNADTISGNRIMALLYEEGYLWIGTMSGGLTLLNTTTGELNTFRHDPADESSLGANGVMSLFKDSRGDVWVGTFGGGASRYQREEQAFVRFPHDPKNPGSLSSPRATSFEQGPDGLIWVGTDGGGLNLLDPATGKSRYFRHDPGNENGLSSDTVYSLHADADGVLWVGTRAGLDRLDWSGRAEMQHRFSNISLTDGLANDVIYGIQPDNESNLWLSTNYALSRFNPLTMEIRNYHRSHGLQGEEFNFGAHYRSKTGELYFGGANGFNAFFPDDFRINSISPPVVLISVSKFNTPAETTLPYHALDQLTLEHQDSVVSFEVAALDYTAPDENKYAYKLDGFDADWINLGNLNRITFTNLDSGDYVLRVKAANSDGIWNEAGISLPITMRPAPWLTGWAYTGYLMAVLGLLYGLRRVHSRRREMEIEYMHRLEHEVRERTQELASRNVDLEHVNRKLAEASLTDPLTGLRNRRFLFEEVSKDVELMRRDHADGEAAIQKREHSSSGQRKHGQDLAFMMLDLDHFKPINDRCGHVAGDRILIQVRDALLKACRSSDFIIRWGGDEFLIVGRHADRDEVESMAERVRAQIARTVFALGDGQVARTTCSIGFACYPFMRSQPDLLSWQQILGLADSAMYMAKQNRNAWTGYLSTEKSSEVENIFKAIREVPEDLEERGQLEVRSGSPSSKSACA